MAVATTADIHLRIDRSTKEESERILDKIGISMSDLFNMTLRRLIRVKDIPFETSVDEARLAVPGRRITTRAELDAYLQELADTEADEKYVPAEEVLARLSKRFA